MKYILISLFLFVKVQGQSTMPPVQLDSKPRTKIDYDKPGHYEMVAQIQKSEIDPKSSIDIDIYFSGYGEIRGVCLLP